MKPSGIRRFFDLAQTMENVVSLGVGEPDFITPWNVREASYAALESKFHGEGPKNVEALFSYAEDSGSAGRVSIT